MRGAGDRVRATGLRLGHGERCLCRFHVLARTDALLVEAVLTGKGLARKGDPCPGDTAIGRHARRFEAVDQCDRFADADIVAKPAVDPGDGARSARDDDGFP